MAFNPFYPPNLTTPGSQGGTIFNMDPAGPHRRSLLNQQQEQVGGSFQSMLDAITRMLGGAGGGGLPKRSDLLDPRLGDITEMFGGARNKMMNQFASMGRDVTGSVPQERLAGLSSREGLERQRAMGDVDTLLAELGIKQSAQLPQLLTALMQMFGGMFK
jgi:hypothetical protein